MDKMDRRTCAVSWEAKIVTAVGWCFFFQAEDGIRDLTVTGVQTCALPIWLTVNAATPAVAGGTLNPGRGSSSPAPSQVVVINPGPAATLAVVKTVRMTVTFDRDRKSVV